MFLFCIFNGRCDHSNETCSKVLSHATILFNFCFGSMDEIPSQLRSASHCPLHLAILDHFLHFKWNSYSQPLISLHFSCTRLGFPTRYHEDWRLSAWGPVHTYPFLFENGDSYPAPPKKNPCPQVAFLNRFFPYTRKRNSRCKRGYNLWWNMRIYWYPTPWHRRLVSSVGKGQRRSAQRDVVGSKPGQTTQEHSGSLITEKNVLSLSWHLQTVRLSVLFG